MTPRVKYAPFVFVTAAESRTNRALLSGTTVVSLFGMRTSAVTEQPLHFGSLNIDVNSSHEFPIYLTLKEVAALLKVKPRTVYAWVSDRRIPFERKGGLLRFRLDAVTAWDEPER